MYSVTVESSSISVIPKGKRKLVISLGKCAVGGTVVGVTGVVGPVCIGPGDQGKPSEGKENSERGVSGAESDGPEGFVGI